MIALQRALVINLFFVQYRGIYFPYLSGQVVRKSYWDSLLLDTDVKRDFSSYVHLLMIMKIIKKHPRWMYVHDPLLKCRMGNDSFLDQGYYKRFEIDAVRYFEIISELNFSRRLNRKIVSRLIRIVLFSHTIRAILELKDPKLTRKMVSRTFEIYKSYSSFWLYIAWWWIVPNFLPRFLRLIYRATLKPYRTRMN